MPRMLRAATPAELEAIDGAIHDQRFDVHGVEGEDAIVRVPFFVEDVDGEDVLEQTRGGRPKKALIPLLLASLVVGAVQECDVFDQSRIGVVTAVELRFMPETRELTLEAAENAEVVLRVGVVDVTLAVTNDVIGRVVVRYFRFGEARGGIELFTQ